MSAKTFVDTNILVYSRDASEPEKQRVAEAALQELWKERRGALSTQVLNEYFVTVTRKLDPGLNPDEAWDDIDALSSWEPLAIDYHLLREAFHIQMRYQLSWWDSLIVAAADATNCEVILSEDLSAGQNYKGIEVVNPFAEA
ncbi:MAG TPA: PIN domain-containing protein [Opitutales bacterium]|nr:PIN domain-containing protein [Opitutales bacterium]